MFVSATLLVTTFSNYQTLPTGTNARQFEVTFTAHENLKVTPTNIYC